MSVIRRPAVVFAVFAVFAAGAGVFWYTTRPSPGEPPPVPDEVTDLAVRAAIIGARNAVLLNSRSADAWGDLGRVFRAHNLLPQAKRAFAEAARLDPKSARWLYHLGLTAELLPPDDSLPYFEAALTRAATPEEKSAARLKVAELLLDRGKSDEAERLYREELAANPRSDRAEFGLGAALAGRDPAAAIPHLERAAASRFARKKAAALLATVYRRVGDDAAAARREAELARLPADPAWPDPFVAEVQSRVTGRQARMRDADALEAEGRYAEAARLLADAARTYPDPGVYVALGTNFVKLGEYDRAEAALNAALAKDPTHSGARFQLGFARYRQAAEAFAEGDKDRSVRLFAAALHEFRQTTAKPESGNARYYAGLCLLGLGRLREAADELRAAVRIQPELPEVHLALGSTLLDLGEPQAAIPPLEAAARLDPDNPNARALLDKARAAAGTK
jgi:tetratricopeptide (TPR) repeat protein